MHIVCEISIASFPVPHSAFRRLQYILHANDGKLGVGLGMRLRLAHYWLPVAMDSVKSSLGIHRDYI